MWDIEGLSLLLDQVKLPPSNGGSTSPWVEMKLEKPNMAGEKDAAPYLFEGNHTTLKSPPTNQGTSHQL